MKKVNGGEGRADSKVGAHSGIVPDCGAGV